MATPVPVVSMMYFLLSTPPKISDMVSPAFSATSTKLAIGCGPLGAGFAVCCANKALARNSRRVVLAMGRQKEPWPGTKSMLTPDTRSQIHVSQLTAPLGQKDNNRIQRVVRYGSRTRRPPCQNPLLFS